MPSAITSYGSALVCIISYYSIFYCTLSLIDLMSPTPWCLQDMYHDLITCSPGAWLGICHVLITCSSGACNAYTMPSLHEVSELGAYMPCPHYMQFWRVCSICHATITCSSGIYWADDMPSIDTSSEHVTHMPCPQLLLCIALCYIVLPCIILNCNAFQTT
jgi:hypothetical protein